VEVSEELLPLAGEDGEGVEDVLEVGGGEVVGLRDGAVGTGEQRPQVAVVGDMPQVLPRGTVPRLRHVPTLFVRSPLDGE